MQRRFWINDRRRFQRLKVTINVWFRLQRLPGIFEEREIDATMLNISEGGVALLTKYDCPLKSMILIKFMLFKTDNEGIVGFSDPVLVIGEVRTNNLTEYNEHRLGICFKALSPENRHEVAGFVTAGIS